VLALSQQDFARELGVRQQTISEWETGVYAPRGASARLLDMVAEHAGVSYGDSPTEPISGTGSPSTPDPADGAG
jgi:transcriptional regulator with XRE-family HTH domain